MSGEAPPALLVEGVLNPDNCSEAEKSRPCSKLQGIRKLIGRAGSNSNHQGGNMSHKITKMAACLIIMAFVASAFAYTTDQASRGKDLYVKNCAACHGANGEGGPVPAQFGKLAGMQSPRLVGPGFLPGMETVGQVYDFARKNMPGDKPGSLKGSEYLDIISFTLQANGIQPDGKLLTATSAKQITIPGRK